MRAILPLLGLFAVGCIYLGQPNPQCPVAATPLSVEEQAVFADLGPDKANDLWIQHAAQLLAQHESDTDAWSHVDEFGNHLSARLAACGLPDVDTRYANEVIPYGGDGSAQGVIDALHDPVNAASVGDLFDTNYTHAGVSRRQSTSGTWYWVLVVTS